MANLYELTEQFANLESALEAFANDEEGQAAINAAMEQISGSIEEKAEGYCKVIRNWESEVEGLKSEINRLSVKVAVHNNNISRLKANLQTAMEATGKNKIKTTLFNLNIQNNPPSVELSDDFTKWALVNDRYLRYKDPDVDKKAILADLKAGNKVPYAEIKQGRSLRIK